MNKATEGVRSIPCNVGSLWADCYCGRAQDLIAAGFVTAEQLPGQPGRNMGQCSYYRGEPIRKGCSTIPQDEHYLRIVRRVSARDGEVFFVYKGVTAEIRESRMRSLRQTLRQTHAPAAEPPPEQTPADFRGFCLRFMGAMYEHIMSPPSPTFKFNFEQDAREEIVELLEEVIELMRSSDVVNLRFAPAVPAGLVQTARADTAFQEFLTLQGLKDLPGVAGSSEASGS